MEPSYDHAAQPDAPRMLLDYLDHYRGRVVETLRALPEYDLMTSRLPTGWTPLELAVHLAFMERRWLTWGFEGEDVERPFADRIDEDRHAAWTVPQDWSVDDVAAILHYQAGETRRIVDGHAFDDLARAGGRFAEGEEKQLGWILVHVLGEYAQHLGHLDIAAELAGASDDEESVPDGR